MTEMAIEIREADLQDPEQAEALVTILDSYARGPGGQNAPLSEEVRRTLPGRLAREPEMFALLAWVDDEPIGVAICTRVFFTLAARPALSLNDLAVLPAGRGRGVGTALLEAVDALGRRLGCCRITLEVNATNRDAIRLYERLGFGPWDPPILFVRKELD